MATSGSSHRTVLVAVDKDNSSMQALESYLNLMHKPGNKIVLLHVLELPDSMSLKNYDDADMVRMMKNVHERSKKLQEKYVNKLLEMTKSGDARFRIEGGLKPGRVICDVAKEEGVFLIVMGYRGLGMVERMFMGSCSSYVVHHSHCPVAVCYPEE